MVRRKMRERGAVDAMSLQSDLAARFAEGDRASGAPFLALVLMEEVGELAEAVRRGDRAHAGKEVADVAFMAYSIANVLGVDLDEAIRAKFLKRAKDDVTASWTDVPPS
jgi:NTP pyrophosphatase (non-canonical NTP hydrolase)